MRRRDLCALLAFCSALALGLCSSVPALAQTGATGTVNITVTDPSGAVVPGADIQIQDIATNDIRKASTQDNGTYSFPNLAFGVYRLTVSKQGFATQIFQSVQVQTARVTDVPVVMKIATTQETVQVITDATPLIETTS